MTRRRDRVRPATPEEREQVERFAELARAALDAPAGERPDAYARMRRAADRIRDPGNLSNVPARDLPSVISSLYPDLDTPSVPEDVRKP